MKILIETLDSNSRPSTLGNIISGKRTDVSVDNTVKADAVVMEKPRVACGSEALTGV
jgi:hypothetical protein